MYAYIFILPFSQLFLYSSFRQHAFILKSISANFSLVLTLKTLYMYFDSILQQYLTVGTIILILEKTIPKAPELVGSSRGETYRWPINKKVPQASRSK